MPVDEVLAYVQGAGASISTRLADSRSGRSKRKDVAVNVQRMRKKEPNGELEPALEEEEDDKHDVPIDDLTSVDDNVAFDVVLAGKASPQLILSSKPPTESPHGKKVLQQQQHMDAWLSLEMAQHLTFHDDFNDNDLEQKKEREFVTVCKKKKPKSDILVNGGGADRSFLAPERLREMAHCVSGKNGKSFSGNSVVQRILTSNSVVVSRNSSELSFSHSIESDVDDMNRFGGEHLDEATACESGELLAPTHWYDARDDTASSTSYRLSSSSYDSLRGFECAVSSDSVQQYSIDDDIEVELPARGVPDGDEEVLDFEASLLLNCKRNFDVKSVVLETTVDEATSLDCRSTEDLERAQPAGRCSSQSGGGVPLNAVVFVDSVARSSATTMSTKDLCFTYGCTVSEHLSDGGICIDFGCQFISNNSLESLQTLAVDSFCQNVTVSSIVEAGFTIDVCSPSDSEYNFVFRKLVPEELESPVKQSTCHMPIDSQAKPLTSFNGNGKSSTFCVGATQAFLHNAFEEVRRNLKAGKSGVEMFSAP